MSRTFLLEGDFGAGKQADKGTGGDEQQNRSACEEFLEIGQGACGVSEGGEEGSVIGRGSLMVAWMIEKWSGLWTRQHSSPLLDRTIGCARQDRLTLVRRCARGRHDRRFFGVAVV